MLPHSVRASRFTSDIATWLLILLTFGAIAPGFGICLLAAQESDVPQAAASPPTTPAKPITEQEANEFAEQFDASIEERDIDRGNKLIDWEAILHKATETPKSPKLTIIRQNFCKGLTGRLPAKTGMIGRIQGEIENGGTYKCIQVSVAAEPFVLFRLQLPDDKGLNYHRYELKRNASGAVVASDIYIFLTAERLSETLRRVWTPFAHSQLRSGLENLLLPQDPYVASLDALGKFGKLVSGQKPVEALELYHKLPAVVRQDKNALILRLTAAQAVSDEEYLDAVNDFRKYHPDDLATDFIMIDGYAMRMKFAEALACVQRTRKLLGGDSMLLIREAQFFLELKKVPEARKAVEDAILGEPDLSDSYFMGINVSLVDQNFDETVKYLTILESQFDQQFQDLQDSPEFADFVKSPQGQKWAETQKK
jgi:hypothetical protein